MWTKATEIPGINDVFNGLTLSSITLNVPAGTKDFYEAKAVWKNFNIVEQAAAILTLSQTALSFPATAGSQTVNLTANIAWTAVSSDAWLTVTPLLGTGDAVLTISAATNTGSSARTATVILSDGGSLTPTVTVTQAAAVIIVKPSVTIGLLDYDLSPVAYDGRRIPSPSCQRAELPDWAQ
jgi:hypothetical protein